MKFLKLLLLGTLTIYYSCNNHPENYNPFDASEPGYLVGSCWISGKVYQDYKYPVTVNLSNVDGLYAFDNLTYSESNINFSYGFDRIPEGNYIITPTSSFDNISFEPKSISILLKSNIINQNFSVLLFSIKGRIIQYANFHVTVTVSNIDGNGLIGSYLTGVGAIDYPYSFLHLPKGNYKITPSSPYSTNLASPYSNISFTPTFRNILLISNMVNQNFTVSFP